MTRQIVILINSNHKKSLKEVFGRIIWFIVWKLTASWTPRFFNPWRILLLRMFGATIGKKVLVLSSVRIDIPWNLEIGDYSAIGMRVWVYNFAKVIIGSNTVISQDSVLCTSSHNYEHPHFTLYSKAILVGSQTWIAANCFVMPGISIGNGSVVGACSVVTRDIGNWKICAGNPCRPLKERIMSTI